MGLVVVGVWYITSMTKGTALPSTPGIRGILSRDLTKAAILRVGGLRKAVAATPLSKSVADQQLKYAADFLYLAEKALKNYLVESGLAPEKGEDDNG